jgi:hypothetical protein
MYSTLLNENRVGEYRALERDGKREREREIMWRLSPGPPALLPSDREYQIPSG